MQIVTTTRAGLAEKIPFDLFLSSDSLPKPIQTLDEV